MPVQGRSWRLGRPGQVPEPRGSWIQSVKSRLSARLHAPDAARLLAAGQRHDEPVRLVARPAAAAAEAHEARRAGTGLGRDQGRTLDPRQRVAELHQLRPGHGLELGHLAAGQLALPGAGRPARPRRPRARTEGRAASRSRAGPRSSAAGNRSRRSRRLRPGRFRGRTPAARSAPPGSGRRAAGPRPRPAHSAARHQPAAAGAEPAVQFWPERCRARCEQATSRPSRIRCTTRMPG